MYYYQVTIIVDMDKKILNMVKILINNIFNIIFLYYLCFYLVPDNFEIIEKLKPFP